MTIAYYQPTFESNYLGAKLVNFSSDVLKVGLIASGTLSSRANTETYATVAQLLVNSPGSALTEVVGGGYSRLSLSGTSFTETGLVVTLTASNPTWSSATFSTVYGFLYDYTAASNSDTNGALMCIWDFQGTQTVTSTNFTLLIPSSGLVTWTSAQ